MNDKILICEKCGASGLDTDIILNVHDEFTCEACETKRSAKED